MPRPPIRTTAGVLAVLPLSSSSSVPTRSAGGPDRLFTSVPTLAVSGEVADILAATPDGRTVISKTRQSRSTSST